MGCGGECKGKQNFIARTYFLSCEITPQKLPVAQNEEVRRSLI